VRLWIHESVVHRDEGDLSCTLRTTPSSASASVSASVSVSATPSSESGKAGLAPALTPDAALSLPLNTQYYPWSYKNSYLLLTTKECLAFGGGGHFALYLVRLTCFSVCKHDCSFTHSFSHFLSQDADLNNGSSGPCETFNSPCLASEESFQCMSCELFVLQSPC